MKKVIDERQEKDMYVIEHYGFWIAFYGLLGIVLYKVIAGYSFLSFVLEVCLLLTLIFTIIIGYYKKGIWRPYAKASQKEYIMTSIITFMAIVIIYLLIQIVRKVKLTLYLIGIDLLLGLIGGIIVYILAYILGQHIIKKE